MPSSLVTSLANYQVAVMRRWDDGSVKHAIVSGRAALTQNVALTVNVSTGTPPAGTALTAASIEAAAPSASVQCGAIGTVSLASLLGSPVRTFVSGAEMVECHYRGDVGGGTQLSVWFHVRLFAGGRVWVRAIVENGYLDNGSGGLASISTQSYVPTVTIGGTVVFNNGSAALSHYANTRWMAEGWIGGDPQVTPLVDVAYLRAARIVPNHAAAPNSSVLSALTQAYTPMGRAAQEPDMGTTGYQEGIGLLPHWNAAFISSGDARALRATLAGSSALNSYPIVWRAKSTNLPIRPSDFATWTVSGAGAGGVSGITAGSLRWEASHFPGEGYLAYLLTGDYWHLETMALHCATIWATTSSTQGSGNARTMSPGQVRGRAWALRSLGLYAALAPDAELSGSTPAADYRTLLANNYSQYAAAITGGLSMVYTGSLTQAGNYGLWETAASGGSAAVGSVPPWQTDFLAATHGFLSELEPLASMPYLIAVRDHTYKWVVGRLGPEGDPNSFAFTQAAQYGIKVASSNSDSTWYSTWGLIWQNSMGTANSGATNTLSNGNISNGLGGMDSYWGNLQPAIAYAVDHGAVGAGEAYNRMVGATNWATVAAGFAAVPVWAVGPLTPPAVPSWLGAVGEWTAIPNSSFTSSGVGWSGTNPNIVGGSSLASGDSRSVFQHWGSAVLAHDGVFRGGAYARGPHLVGWGGGHNNYGGNEMYAFGPLTSNTPSWARLTAPTIPAPNNVARDANGYPTARHTYNQIQYSQATRELISLGCGAGFSQGWSINSGDAFKFNVNPYTVNPWTPFDAAIAVQGGPGYIKYKSFICRWTGLDYGIGINNASAKLTQFDPLTKTSTHWTIDNSADDTYSAAAFASDIKVFVWMGNGATLFGVDARSLPAGGSNISRYTIATTGTGPTTPDQFTLDWDEVGRRFICWCNSGKTLYFLTPSASPYSGGTAWAWSSVTPASGATPASTFAINPNPGEGQGTNGRGRIVQGNGWRGYLVMPNETSPICIYRLN